MAAGALSVLDENGIQAPDKMSIIGFDDGLIARYISPRLTTIRYPIRVVRQAIDPESNPWGLALDGYARDGPRRLTDAELAEPGVTGATTNKESSQ